MEYGSGVQQNRRVGRQSADRSTFSGSPPSPAETSSRAKVPVAIVEATVYP
jgi:hypothetical protein